VAGKKSNEEMLGEVLRDIGILIVVFFPFDEWLTFHQLTWRFVAGSTGLSAVAVALGMTLERLRKE